MVVSGQLKFPTSYATLIKGCIAICKFKRRACVTLNVNRALIKVNLSSIIYKAECSAKHSTLLKSWFHANTSNLRENA